MDLYRKAQFLRRLEYARDFICREGNRFAKAVDGIRQSLTRDMRELHIANLIDVAALVAICFQGKRMCPEEGARDSHAALLAKPRRRAQHLCLAGGIEPVS